MMVKLSLSLSEALTRERIITLRKGKRYDFIDVRTRL